MSLLAHLLSKVKFFFFIWLAPDFWLVLYHGIHKKLIHNMNTQMFSTLKFRFLYIFLQQIIILEWFLKDRVTMKTSNDAENSALITGINDLLKYTQIENSFLKL